MIFSSSNLKTLRFDESFALLTYAISSFALGSLYFCYSRILKRFVRRSDRRSAFIQTTTLNIQYTSPNPPKYYDILLFPSSPSDSSMKLPRYSRYLRRLTRAACGNVNPRDVAQQQSNLVVFSRCIPFTVEGASEYLYLYLTNTIHHTTTHLLHLAVEEVIELEDLPLYIYHMKSMYKHSHIITT